ncbi:MAG: hypothetical protein RJA70_816 [Pseudomonadota bacterium]|jgi:DNA-binding LacI/PurR family transcriptional regulator
MSFSIKPEPPGPSPVYALLVESLDDEHEVAVIRGVVAGAREAGATVLCVAGGMVDDPDPDRRARNAVFDLVVPAGVQGIVVMSSAIGTAQGVEALSQWLGRYSALPVCCVGIPVEGYRSLRVDNYSGLKSLTEHLIVKHDCQRIAYIDGPAQSPECVERFTAYQDALQAHDLEFNAELVVAGDYSKQSGARAMRTLLEERRISGIEAVVAANDFMALGAMEELAQRGIRVPEDIKVIGFDDIESARHARPALTTVRQPAELLGKQGAQLLTRLLSPDSRVSERPDLPTELVIRNSCGCVSLDGSLGMAMQETREPGSDASFVDRRQVILAEVVRASRGTFGGAGAGWESRLLDALIAELRGSERGIFTRSLHQSLSKLDRAGVDADAVQEVLSALRRQSLACVASDRVARGKLEDILHDARVFASAIVGHAQAARTRALGVRFRELRSAFRARMFGAAAGLSRVLADNLPPLGVEACLVAALETPDDISSPAESLFGFGPSGRLAPAERFALHALPSHPLLEQTLRTLVLLPLVFDGQTMGAAVLAVRTLNGGILDELMELFAVATRARYDMKRAAT